MKYFHKLLLMVLLAGLLPTAALVWRTLDVMEQRLSREARRGLELEVRALRSRVDLFLADVERKLAAFGQSAPRDEAARWKSAATLALAQNPEIEVLSLLDEGGQEAWGESRRRISGHSDPISPEVLRGHLLSLDEDLLRRAEREGRALSNLENIGGRPWITLVLPLAEQGNAASAGFLAARLRLSRVQGMMDLERENAAAQLRGAFLAGPENRPVLAPAGLGLAALEGIFPGTELARLRSAAGSAIELNETSLPSGRGFAVLLPLWESGYGVGIYADRDDALEAAHQLRRSVLGLGLAGLLLAIAISYFASRRAVAPLEKLQKAALAYGAGQFDHALEIPGRDELAELGRRFKEMAGRIAALLRIEVENTRREQELLVAQAVQETLIPAKLPDLPGFQTAAYYRSASETGGDWYGCIEVPREEAMIFAFGDVTGHGVGSALITAACQATMHLLGSLPGSSGADLSPARVLGHLDSVVRRCAKGRLGMTAFVIKLYWREGRAICANAGHPFPFLISSVPEAADPVDRLLLPGNPLGMAGPPEIQEQVIELSKGRALFVCSDGLLEGRNPADRQYGKRRLLRVLAEHRRSSAEEILKAVRADAETFYGVRPPEDDITIFALRASNPHPIPLRGS